jgi:hypothetical protein
MRSGGNGSDSFDSGVIDIDQQPPGRCPWVHLPAVLGDVSGFVVVDDEQHPRSFSSIGDGAHTGRDS